MGILAVFSLLVLLSGTAHAASQPARDVSLAPRSQLPTAEFTVPFSSKIPRRESKKKAKAALRGKHGRSGRKTEVLNGAAFDQEYVLNITVGGKVFNAILDTGSSDTWVVHDGFSCLDLNGTAVPAATCDFGPSHFNPADSPTFQPFPNATFFVRYGSGEFLRGPAGFDTVTVAGLSVSQQEIGVPNSTAFLGDGVSEGVLGLAFPRLTSVFLPDPQNASHIQQMPYSPFFINAIEHKKVKSPLFSISLDRPTLEQQANESFTPHLGFLSFGGIVPVPVLETSVTAPVQEYAFDSAGLLLPSDAPEAQFFWYSLDIDSYTFPGSETLVTKSNKTFTDSGSTLNIVPSHVAAAYNAQFNPPATFDAASDTYIVACNATAPRFGVVIGGMAFDIDPRDQIVAQRKDNGNTFCISGTQGGGPDVPGNVFTLGDVFLHNVVTTYHPVEHKVTITQRVPY
ncbi:acid protease, partial [Mycena vulgaris]